MLDPRDAAPHPAGELCNQASLLIESKPAVPPDAAVSNRFDEEVFIKTLNRVAGFGPLDGPENGGPSTNFPVACDGESFGRGDRARPPVRTRPKILFVRLRMWSNSWEESIKLVFKPLLTANRPSAKDLGGCLN